MEMHREEPAADKIRLLRRAQAQGHIRLAHREIELIVGQQHLQLDIRVEIEKLAEARREPDAAQRDIRRDLQFAIRLLAAIREAEARLFQLRDEFARRAEQHLALLGEHEAARMAMEQRHVEFVLERRDLPRYRRLRQTQHFAGPREAARLRRGIENPDPIPIHAALQPAAQENADLHSHSAKFA